MKTETEIPTSAAGVTICAGSATAMWHQARPATYAARFSNGSEETYGDGSPSFTLIVRDHQHLQRVLTSDPYSAALSFIRGEFELVGDVVAAVRFQLKARRSGWRDLLYGAAARLPVHSYRCNGSARTTRHCFRRPRHRSAIQLEHEPLCPFSRMK